MKINIGRYPKKFGAERKVKLEFHPYDTWNLDHTLALIIAPLLRQLKATKHGVPSDMFEDREDRSDEAFGAAEAKWNATMDKMIEAFELVLADDPDPMLPGADYIAALKAREESIAEGLALFAKHYGSLWD